MKKCCLYIISILLLFDSCRKADHILLTAQEFPTSIGSWWIYQVLDQNNNILDTLNVTIVGMQTVNGTPMQEWITTSRRYLPDTDYVFVSSTSIQFYTKYEVDYLSINFPVIENQAWTTPVQGVTYTENIQNISVHNAIYNGATYLNQSAPYSVNYSLDESIWIAKNIGIVKHITAGDGGPPYTNDQLISYHIN